MNSSIYIFGSLSSGYIQFPEGNNNTLFKTVAESIHSKNLIAVRRDSNLLYYIYAQSLSARQTNSQYIGFAIVFNGLYYNDVSLLFPLFEDAFTKVILSGKFVELNDEGELVANTMQIQHEEGVVNKVIKSLSSSVQALPEAGYKKLPPVNLSVRLNESIKISDKSTTNEVDDALLRYNAIDIYKDEDSYTVTKQGRTHTAVQPVLAKVEEYERKRIKHTESFLWAGIIVCAISIISGAIYLLNDNILDKVIKYENAGIAVLQLEREGPKPHIFVMNKSGLYYDDLDNTTEILPVGKEVETRVIQLEYDPESGFIATAKDAKGKLAITTSRGLSVKRLSPNTYLLLSKPLSANPLTSKNLSLEQCYLVNKKDKSVIKVPKSITDGNGHLCWRISCDFLEQFGSLFKLEFSENDYRRIVERNYGHYLATIELSLENGAVQILDPIEFDVLGYSYPSNFVGTREHCFSLCNTIAQVFRSELIESFYACATELTGVSDRKNMRISDDDTYTFVIDPFYQSGHEPKALFRVNNSTHVRTLIDTGMEVEYGPNEIRVRKYDTFLLFFDSHKDIYYNYAGKRTR